MDQLHEYVGILRCQTWNTWPEKTGIEYPTFLVDCGAAEPIKARLVVLSYEPRTTPHVYSEEDTKRGPLVWDGRVRGLHLIRDAILMNPEDVVEVSVTNRHAHRGEIDICLIFMYSGDLPVSVVDSVRSSASAVLSLLNLLTNDFLVPSTPFQVRKSLPGNENQMDTTFWMHIQTRQTVDRVDLEPLLRRIAATLESSPFGRKLSIALELYATHVSERQARVRFLLLVIAMETLATATRKHDIAIDLLAQWKSDLDVQKRKYQTDSEEWMSLDALGREMNFRKEDSIRSQIRKLFRELDGYDAGARKNLQKRALSMYDRRSALVHDGYLPADELADLENEARELLEVLFKVALADKRLIAQAASEA